MATYRGPSITLKHLIYDQPHNFIEQSREPKEMVISPINGDGYGVAWYVDHDPEPAVITSEKPLWHDINVPRIAGKISSSNIFMHVRAASPGLPVHQANSHPFQWKQHLFMHNGLISDFRKNMMRPLRQQIADPFYSHLLGTTDSEHIFNLYLSIRQEYGDACTIQEALLETFKHLNQLAMKHSCDLILNFIVSDGKETVVTKYTTVDKAGTLYFTTESPAFPNAIVVASEPLSYADKSWQPFPMNEMLVIDENHNHTFVTIPNPFIVGGKYPTAKPVTLQTAIPME
jgi:ergothioneine biosynthesis protein EgtC